MKTKFITFKDDKEIILLEVEGQIYLTLRDLVSITHDDVYSIVKSEYYAPDNMMVYYME